jgi:hypothetical protein
VFRRMEKHFTNEEFDKEIDPDHNEFDKMKRRGIITRLFVAEWGAAEILKPRRSRKSKEII